MTVFFIVVFVLAFITGILKYFVEDSNKKKPVITTSNPKRSSKSRSEEHTSELQSR